MTHGPLVIGYGNVLRSDDGIGWRVAEAIANDERFEGVTVLQRHQLTPELALDVSRADIVVLVDATRERPAGTFAIEPVVADRPGGAPAWTHQMDPGTIALLAAELYGSAPDVHVVRVGVESLDVGQELSPPVEAAVPTVVEAIAGMLARRAVLAPS
jgi:hydrogenase maturation protease